MGRAPCCEKVGLKKGKWAKEEDEILASYIKTHGEGSWRSLPKKAGLLRCGKSCRLRWINYLRSGLKRGNFSKEEENLIIKLHANLGNKWSQIASELPGRTDNCIKNYWNSYLSRSINSYQPTTKSTDVKAINTESVESLDSSHKSSEKNAKKMAQPTNKTRQRKLVDRALHPQNLTNHCEELQNELSSVSDVDATNGPYNPIPFMNSEFSYTMDEPSILKEEIINVTNGAYNPTIFVNSEFLGGTGEPSIFKEKITNGTNRPYSPIIFMNSEFSCTTDEPSTFKEEITNVINGPYSPITFVNSEFLHNTGEPSILQDTNAINGPYFDEPSTFKEEITNTTNGPYNPIIFVNSKFSCITDEPSTFKEEITSPDLTTFLKEMDELLNLEIKEQNPEQEINNFLGDMDDDNLLLQLGMDEMDHYGDLGCLDPSWDLDLLPSGDHRI